MHSEKQSACRSLCNAAATAALLATGATAGPTPIDTNAPYYLASQLGITVLPVFKGGTLLVDQEDATYAQNFLLENYNDNTIFVPTTDATFSGVISGPGGFIRISPGNNGSRLLLTGNNTYTGLTQNRSGSLVIGNGGTTGSIAGDIINNGLVTFARSDIYTFAGGISGTGSVQQFGGAANLGNAGKLILSGTNTYSGETIVSYSTIEAGSPDAFSPHSWYFLEGASFYYRDYISVLDLNGFNETIGSLNGYGEVHLGTGSLTVNSGGSYQGVISGTGGLIVAGGVLNLYGRNTYSGGTTIAAGAELFLGLTGNIHNPGAIVGNIENNGTLTFVDSDAPNIFSGNISGTGSLVLDDPSGLALPQVLLTGTNTYTGGTFLGGYISKYGACVCAELRIGNGGTTGSIVGNVTDNGYLIFNRSDSYTFSGNVSGTGYLVQEGSGTLILTGSNTYTSGTPRYTDFPHGTMIAIGTLQLGDGGTTGSIVGDVYITGYGTLAFNRSNTYIFAGAISGNGSVQQIGGGTTILTGTNTYTGGTTISAGTLVVGDTAHPGASVTGDVAVNGGSLKGHGTIHGIVANIAGNVQPGSSIGTLTVTSYTQTAAGTLTIEMTPGTISQLAVTGNAALNGKLLLQFDSGSFGADDQTFLTAASVTGAFTTAEASGLPADLAYGLVYETQDVRLITQPKKSGQVYGDLVTTTIDTAHAFGLLTVDPPAEACSSAACTDVTYWITGFGEAGSLDAGSPQSDAFNTRTLGIAAGADYNFAGGTTIGMVVGFSQSALTISNGWGKALVNTTSVAVRGRTGVLNGRLDADLYYTTHNTAAHRVVAGRGTAYAEPDGDGYGGVLQFSYPEHSTFSAFGRISYVRITQAAMAEQGLGANNLFAGSSTHASARGTFGLRFGDVFDLGNGARFIPDAWAGVETELADTERTLQLQFADGSFEAPHASPESTLFVAGGTLRLQIAPLTIGLWGNGRLGDREQSGRIGLSVAF
ncbi:autotransporter outer membrane beta-barrel domain-containing protein [Rhizomicrobium electricum]|uniref:Autotransporter domain-containing protein n=1 Tax=Rhizomicrobium electricum TaxID=480070 RepID=A0ABN1EJY8_9PROT|nr:autotransporter outer membrane beta-barrel domain-containing protein [Rhizomicrobium electricum]NIJ47156.1 autotransporter-associated beta strand protein [Rhizomicrobium electricum]